MVGGKQRNINWKLRFTNKTVLIALIGTVITFIYQLLAIFGVVPPVSENDAVELCGLIVNVLVGIGVVVDPTTEGVSDSARALTYDAPKTQNESIDEIEIETAEDEEPSDSDPEEGEIANE